MIQAVLPVEFIMRRVWWHKELCHLIKQKHGMHEYYHKTQLHNNTLPLILSQTKQSESDTH